MTALTRDRNTKRREGALRSLPVEANVVIYAGAIVVKNAAGRARPGVTGTNLVVLGRAPQRYDNTNGAAGAFRVDYEPGEFAWMNSTGADAITEADVGNDCFLVSDQMVARTNGGGTRSRAGVVTAVSAATGEVWVTTGITRP